MLKTAAISFGLLLLALAAPAQALDFKEGQAWSYRTRPGEEASQIYIVRIDRDLRSKPIFHLYIDGLKLKNPLIEGGIQDHLLHVPVSQESLAASVIQMTQANSAPIDISEGYDIWRQAFVNGSTGVFALPVGEIVQYIENAFNKPK
jgi:hypothetical protein